MQSLTLMPLHGGKAPKWLFARMVKLARCILEIAVNEYGTKWVIEKISDPDWFQALACALGYDWHSSGTTTVTMAALKEALDESNLGIVVAGGKGKEGIRTPEEIERGADVIGIGSMAKEFSDYSRIIAKVDGSIIYDGISIYQHTFVFSKDKDWCIVQQAMELKSAKAIRFQVDGSRANPSDLTTEINNGVVSSIQENVYDLTFQMNRAIKEKSLLLVNEDLGSLLSFRQSKEMPSRHEIIKSIDLSERARALLKYANDMQPESYQELLEIKGLGGKTLKSIAFISSLLYNEEIYKRDPVFYSYNLGGKDGIPYKINKAHYDSIISSLKEIIENSNAESTEKYKSLKRLSMSFSENYKQESSSMSTKKST
ncbi:MAG: DUF763 domain-containing protein [Candidatus Micrarchaeia archaeon]